MTNKALASTAHWLTVAGAVLAVPVAMVVTCLVRGELSPYPGEGDLSGPNLIYRVLNISVGALIGCAVAANLAVVASAIHHKIKKNGQEVAK